MDANVKVLMDATGCTETEAESVLTAAGNDISKAMKLFQEKERDVLVFQASFSPDAPAAGRGYFMTVINVKSENVIHTDIAYPLSAEQAKGLDINMPATVFGSTLRSAKNDLAERHRAACRSNLSQLRSKMTSSFARALLSDNRSSRVESINDRIATLINGIYNEEFTVRHTARAQSAQAIASLTQAPEQQLSPEQSAAKLFADPEHKTAHADPGEIPSASPQEELPKIVLICEPEIAPFDGKPARSLMTGEEVIVKIKDGREAARYFSELLGGSVGDELVPLAVPTVKIDTMSETFVEAYVEFGPGIYGQFFVPPDVKVKTPDENVEIYDPFANEVSVFSERRFGYHIMGGLILLIVSTIILIFTFLKSA